MVVVEFHDVVVGGQVVDVEVVVDVGTNVVVVAAAAFTDCAWKLFVVVECGDDGTDCGCDCGPLGIDSGKDCGAEQLPLSAKLKGKYGNRIAARTNVAPAIAYKRLFCIAPGPPSPPLGEGASIPA